METGRGGLWRRTAVCLAGMLAAGTAVATVTGWGDNSYSQRTIGAGSFVGARAIGAGYWHTLVVASDGSVTAIGRDASGESTVPSGLGDVTAVSGGRDHSLALKADGTVVAWGDNTYGQTNVPADLAGVTAISAGGFHNLALLGNGTVRAWGYGFYGQTGVPGDLTNVMAVAAGNAFSLALCSNGTVHGWGDDFYHQIDIPPDLTNAVGIAAGFAHALAVLGDGRVVMWGDTLLGQGTVPASLTNAVAVSAGYGHSMAMTSIGRVVCWGTNHIGQSTVPSAASNALAVAAGFDHSLALMDDTPRIWRHPTNVVAKTGTNVSFKVAATGYMPSYLWHFNGARIETSWSTNEIRIMNVAVTNAGGYCCVLTNEVGSTTSMVATLTINNTGGSGAPVIVSHPSSESVDLGMDATFAVTATGAVPLVYRWLHGGSDIPGATGTSHTVTGVQPADTGAYHAIVTNGIGAATSSVATLTVRSAPGFTLHPRSMMTNAGATVILSCMATGSPPIGYLWRFQGNPATGASNTLRRSNVTTNDAGEYFAIATNTVGAATGQVAVLQIVETPAQLAPVFTQQPANWSGPQGQSALFEAAVAGAEPFLYRWRFNGADIEDATGPSHTVAAVQLSDAGGYSVIVSNDFGSVTSRTAVLTVGQPPSITGHPQAVNAPYGSRVQFVIHGTGSPTMSCRWFRNGAPLGISTPVGSPLTLPAVTLAQQGSYHAIVTNWAGSATSEAATLTVYTNGLAVVPCQIVSGESTGRLVRLTIALEAGCNYRVQCSTNLVDWDDVTNFLSSAASADFLGQAGTNSALRFFRVVSP
ncbi:MAG: immunoglobulin domain-containing protein [Verrucomicrobia bacterium]|nr:immunoglobulin domain-containing protein [Verrucomicrobiota bacterium]